MPTTSTRPEPSLAEAMAELQAERPEDHDVIGGAILRYLAEPDWPIRAFLATWQDRGEHQDAVDALGAEWAEQARTVRWVS